MSQRGRRDIETLGAGGNLKNRIEDWGGGGYGQEKWVAFRKRT